MAAPAKRNGAPSAISRRAGPAAGEAAKGRDLCDMDHTNDEVKVRQDLRRTWSGRQGGDHEKGQRKVEARSHEESVGSEMETVLEWSSVTADRALPGLKEEGYAVGRQRWLGRGCDPKLGRCNDQRGFRGRRAGERELHPSAMVEEYTHGGER